MTTAVVVLAAVLTACSGDPTPDPTTTDLFTTPPPTSAATPTDTPSATASDTPTSDGDVDVALEDMTADDAAAILAELDTLDLRIAQAVLREDGVGPDATALIQAQAADRFETTLSGFWADDFRSRLRDDPGPLVSEVLEIVGTDPAVPCVGLRVHRDYSQMMTPEGEIDLDWYVALSPKAEDDVAAQSDNPTGYEYAAAYAALEDNDPPCVGATP